jgi:hypothetical protein
MVLCAVWLLLGVELLCDFKLLKLNHRLNYIKCELDDDDDLFVLLEITIRVTDLTARVLLLYPLICDLGFDFHRHRSQIFLAGRAHRTLNFLRNF